MGISPAPSSSFGWSWVYLTPRGVNVPPRILAFTRSSPVVQPPVDSHPDLRDPNAEESVQGRYYIRLKKHGKRCFSVTGLQVILPLKAQP
jgi:hypothetical protein